MTAARTGGQRLVFDSLDSTNAEAIRMRTDGETGPVWITAAQQTAGRGRSGREWVSPIGNLFATYMFPFDGPQAKAPTLGFVAALAVYDTVAAFAPDKSTTLKWPNDVLLEARKVSGILMEGLGPNPDGTLAIAAGIGINLQTHPEPSKTRWPATSLLIETGAAPSAQECLDVLAAGFEHWLSRLAEKGTPAILAVWKERAAHLGQSVTIKTARGDCTGRFVDLDATGALVLETALGRETFAAGDVRLGEAHDAARH